ncbi:MAG TPA: DUF6791 domain-containing protein [Puia sp.]|jgi:hypothetical protein
MQQQLINLSPDLKRLQDEGYDLDVSTGQFLLVRHIPYVTLSRQVKLGTIVCTLTLASPTRTAPPPDHTVYFCGEIPCEAGGLPLNAIINNSNRQQLRPGLFVDHYFSSKPASGRYDSYYDKIRTYAEILCAQAQVIDCHATCRPHRVKTT